MLCGFSPLQWIFNGINDDRVGGEQSPRPLTPPGIRIRTKAVD